MEITGFDCKTLQARMRKRVLQRWSGNDYSYRISVSIGLTLVVLINSLGLGS